MPVQSIFWDTNGTGDGAAAYTEAQLAEWLRKSFLGNPATEGVIANVGGEFVVSGTSSPLTVASGFAYVYGVPAWDNSAATLAIPTPLIGTTGHRVVLRADWAAQTVRLALKSSADGVASAPALEQNAGTRWEISLATVSITTGGAITVTDTRQRAHYNTRVSAAMLDPGAVAAHLGFVPLNKAGDQATGSIQVVKTIPAITNNLYSDAQFESAAPDGKPAAYGFHRTGLDALALYFNGGADLRTRTNNGADGKLWSELNDGDGSGLDADRVAGVDIAPILRRGGHGTDWGVPGGSTVIPANVRTQVGVAEDTPNAAVGVISVTFPVAFAGTPIVTANSTQNSVGGAAQDVVVTILALTATGCNFQWRAVQGNAVSRIAIGWHAIGPAA